MDKNMINFYKGKSILITGGCGSIGSQIVKQLLPFKPKMVKVFDSNESGLFYFQQELINYNNIRYLIGNVRDKDRLRRAIKGVDIIFHAAALKHVPLCEYNPYEAVQTNIIGTENIIDLAREEKVDRMVAISTDKAVNPISTMGATKLISEKLVLAGRVGSKVTKFSCVRFGNVLNSDGSVIPTFLSQIKKGGPVTVTSKEMTRYFMSLSQAVYLVLKAAKETKEGEIFILKMPSLRVIDLAEVLIEMLAPKYGYKPEEIEIKITGIRPGEKLYESLLTKEESFHIINKKNMFILKPAFQAPHVIKKGVNSTPLNPGEYNSNEATLVTKEEIKRKLVEGKVL